MCPFADDGGLEPHTQEDQYASKDILSGVVSGPFAGLAGLYSYLDDFASCILERNFEDSAKEERQTTQALTKNLT